MALSFVKYNLDPSSISVVLNALICELVYETKDADAAFV